MDKTILIEETKKAMGFKEVTPQCENCRFMIETGWNEYSCIYSNIVSFLVKDNSSCDKFDPKY